jgi:NadR type nicotinamide-nucleotide adenylyltransferase
MEKAIDNPIKKIVVLGAESTGKSTLCESLAKHYNTVFVPEYARAYFDVHDIEHYSIKDLEFIAKTQIALEADYVKKANKVLFCDTSLITIKIWAFYKFNLIPDFVVNNIKSSDYHMYLITNNDVPWIADDQRKNEVSREELFKCHQHEMQTLGIKYQVVKGVGKNRLQYAIDLINNQGLLP